MQNTLKITYKLQRNTLLIEGKLVKALVLANLLQDKTCLQRTKFIAGNFYIYQESQGYYVKFSTREVETAVLDLLCRMGLSKYVSKGFIQETSWFLESRLSSKELFRYDLLAFNNGTLDLREMKLQPWSPDSFCTSKINAEFIPDQKPEEFLRFLSHNFAEDEQEFIRAIYRSALMGDNRAQVFIYIYGPGGTGKSTLVNILTMIAGETSTLTTTFRDLSKDKFEGLNLEGKRLICINDTDQYHGDLSVVKAISGGDTIQGRLKHKDGAIEIKPKGLLLITGNQPLQTRDPSGALGRRMRVLRMNKVVCPKDQIPLLYRKGGTFEGPLAKECSGILSWSHMEEDKAFHRLKDLSLTQSLVEGNLEALRSTNPMKEWVEELKVDPTYKSYVGFTPSKTEVNFLINLVRDRKTLYPAYLIYCAKFSLKPLSHIKFTSELEMTCEANAIPIKKGKDRYGAFIQGLAVDIPKLGNILGAPSSEEAHKSGLQTSSEVSNDNTLRISQNAPLAPLGTQDENQYVSLKWETRNPKLYFQYIDALKETPLKKQLNKMAKSFNPDIEDLLKNHTHMLSGLKGIKIPGLEFDFGEPSPEYLATIRVQIEKGLKKTKTLVPFKYKQMGLSPRILPQNYGESINSVKKFVRTKAYRYISSNLEEFTIIDIDLKSCYTAILLGLFPTEMQRVRQAIEGAGLWNTFEEEFIASGKQALFNKPAVKICVYSSFFLGGPRAMINGTLDFMRKEIGLTQAQFDNAPYYEALYALARDVATFVNNTNIIEDFRNISSIIKKEFDGQFIKGPTDHEFKIDGHQFMTSYPNFLQSFEFYLLAQATLKTLEQVPGSELIGHYHDGNVIIVPSSARDEYISLINGHLEKLRQDLELGYKQVIEYQEFN